MKHYIGYESLSSEDVDYNDFLLLVMAMRAINKVRHKEVKQLTGITGEQVGALHAIKHLGNKATLAEIARQMFLERHTISTLIDRMEKKGLVKKIKHLDRENRIGISLTEKGEQAYCSSTERRTIHAIMSTLSEKECKQFRSYLRKLQDEAINLLSPHYLRII